MDELSSNVNIDENVNKMIDYPILLIITDDVESPEIISSKTKFNIFFLFFEFFK